MYNDITHIMLDTVTGEVIKFASPPPPGLLGIDTDNVMFVRETQKHNESLPIQDALERPLG